MMVDDVGVGCYLLVEVVRADHVLVGPRWDDGT